MLISFSVGNFRSIGKEVMLSMESTGIKGKEEENIISDSCNRKGILKSTVIYGANASGKTNLLRAFLFMSNFVINSGKDKQKGENTGVEAFLLDASLEEEPTYFEIIFIYDNIKYRYGFELDEYKVHSEWLYYVPDKREAMLFIRDNDKLKVSKAFSEGTAWKKSTHNLGLKIKENGLFVSVLAQMFSGEKEIISEKIIKWFKNLQVINSLGSSSLLGEALTLLKDNLFVEDINNLIKYADFSIKAITHEIKSVETNKNNIGDFSIKAKVQTHHNYQGKDGARLLDMFNHESEGTKKYFGLAGVLCDILKNGKILVIDELEAHLHPLLTKKIIELFHSKTNAKNAQLIFVTHDTNLLSKDIFRRDQIWFMEKDEQEISKLYSLAEFKSNVKNGVRSTSDFSKNYIDGRYGAIPILNNFDLALKTNGVTNE